jgi:hypothetical protein
VLIDPFRTGLTQFIAIDSLPDNHALPDAKPEHITHDAEGDSQRSGLY